MHQSITSLFVGIALVALATTASADQAKGKLGAAATGKLLKVSGGKVADYALEASPDYYVIYHSASW